MRDFAIERSDDLLRRTFFRSVTMMTSISAIILCACEGVIFPSGITPVIAVFSWVVVDSRRLLKVPVFVGNMLSLAALVVVSMEFYGGTLERKLLSGAHLIVYLTWVVLMLPKGIRQYWWLIALSVLQIAISGILSSGVGFGFAMVGMMLLLLWTMSVFSLFRVQSSHAASVSALGSFAETSSVSQRQSWREFFVEFFGVGNVPSDNRATALPVTSVAMVRDGLQRDPSEVWVGFRFRSMVAGSYVVSLILAAMVFAAFPRVWIPGTSLWGTANPEADGGNRTGFSESVELGDIGTIMESNDRVLSFEVQNLLANRPATVEDYCDAMQMDEVRFRGNVFACYRDGRWTQGFAEHGFSAEGFARPGNMVQRKPAFRLDIIQDPPFSTFVFSPRPVVRARRRAVDRIQEGQVSEVLTWGTANRGTFDRGPRAYSIENCIPVENLFLTEEKNASFLARSDPGLNDEVNELRNSRSEFYSAFYTMNGSFLDRSQQLVLGQRRRWIYRAANDAKELYPEVWKLARELCMKEGGLLPPQKRVDTILQFLSPQNGYKYSRTAARNDRSLDPLVDFILNTKTGHCEYFASACALMLQCAEVPTRLVNGYYGSELNALTGKNEVRQRHAHAWVESYVDHQWITIEPTPSAQRQAEVALSANQSLISNLRSALSDFWSDGIQQMSAERQQEFFAPVISTSKSLVQTIREQGLWVTIRDSSAQFVKNPESWISWQGGVITFLLLLLVAVLAKLNVFEKLWTFLMHLRLRSGHDSSTRSAIRFYEGFCSLCERHGIHFSPANSANENAARAVVEFASRLATDELRQVPMKIASAFNAVRYGHHTLSDDQIMMIGKDLETFAEALKSPQPV